MASPNGSLEMTVDELNRVYKTPIYCFATPVNMISTISSNSTKKESTNSNHNIECHTINLKIRINPGDFNINVYANTSNSILELKQLIVKLSKQQVRKFFFHFFIFSFFTFLIIFFTSLLFIS
jgi:hypothetical protein